MQGLSFRVRNGTGRLTLAMVAANLFDRPQEESRGDRTVTVREPDNGRENMYRLVTQIGRSLPREQPK